MNSGGDAAEQVVRMSLEGVEVVAKITGEAAKNIIPLLVAALKREGKTKGKERLSRMIKSGEPLKVFEIQQKDLNVFIREAKRYGVLYNVLRNKTSKDPNATVDIIARTSDASKINRIFDRFELSKVDKAQIVNEVEQSKAERKAKVKTKPEKSKAQIVAEAAAKRPNEKGEIENPNTAKTEKSPLSEQKLKESDGKINRGDAERVKKPSVRKKIEAYKAEINEQKDVKAPSKNRQTIHKQPKGKKKSFKPKER